MNAETNIVQQALQALEKGTGIKGTWTSAEPEYDGNIDLIIKDRNVRFYVEVKREIRLYHLNKILEMADFHQPFMIVAEVIASPAKEKLRSIGISYLEANGNAFIDYDQTIILIDGNKPVRTTKLVTNRAFTRTGLKGVFHLLNDSEAINRSYRQLAQETGIALGNIKYIMDGLQEAGFILPLNSRKVALKNKAALLERWIAGYRETLKPDLLKGTYKMWSKEKREDWHSIDVKSLDFVWGGEAAAEIITNYLQAEKLTIYTGDYTGKVISNLALIPDDDGDILLYGRFWNKENQDERLAPALLIYADLMITDDPRCIETADIIYKKKLKDIIERD